MLWSDSGEDVLHHHSLVVPVGGERAVPGDPVALLELVPEGGYEPVERMSDNDQSPGTVLLHKTPDRPDTCHWSNLPGLVIWLTGIMIRLEQYQSSV